MKINILKIILFLTLILILFHYRKYSKFNENYEIEQQELDYIKGDELYNRLNPIVITFIEDNTLKYNIDNYSLFSPISISFTYLNLNPSYKYYQFTGEILLVRPNKDIKIELTNPKFIKYFNRLKSDNDNYNQYKLLSKNYSEVSNIEIILHKYNILYIPRFWLINFKNNDSNTTLETFSCHNIFTYFFNIFN